MAVSIGPLSWSTEAEACRDLGLDRNTFALMRIRKDAPLREELLGAAMRLSAARDAKLRAARDRKMQRVGIAAGAVLSADERRQYRALLDEVSAKRGVAVADIHGPSRRGPHVAARREVWAKLRDLGMSVRRIATLAERDWDSVQTGLERHDLSRSALRAGRVAA